MIRFSTRSRAVLAVSLAAILASGCNRSDQSQDDTAPAVVPTEPIAALPAPVQPIDRAALLMAVIDARSAAAIGRDDREAQRKLDGKPFEVRLRFGCESTDGTSGSGPRSKWSFDEERRVLRISFSPDLDGSEPPIARLAQDPYEAVEGFRVLRPWLLSAACPAEPPALASPAPAESPGAKQAAARKAAPTPAPTGEDGPEWAPPFVAIAQFFTEMDARTHRRDSRAYEVTKTLKPGEQPSASGYDLVLSGRLKRLGEGRVIACTVTARDVPPPCVVSVDFDNVAITRADTSEQLARWSTG